MIRARKLPAALLMLAFLAPAPLLAQAPPPLPGSGIAPPQVPGLPALPGASVAALSPEQSAQLEALIARRDLVAKAMERLATGARPASPETLSETDRVAATIAKATLDAQWANWRAQAAARFLENIERTKLQLPPIEGQSTPAVGLHLPLGPMQAYRSQDFRGGAPAPLNAQTPVLKLLDIEDSGLSVVWIFDQGPFFLNSNQIAPAGGTQ